MFQSLLHMVEHTVNAHPYRDALKVRRAGLYLGITYRQLWETIRRLTHGMAAIGLQPGDRIAIFSGNRPEWPITDFAIMALRAISVPLHTNATDQQLKYILNDARVRAVFVENRRQAKRFLEFQNAVPSLEFVIPFDLPKPTSSIPHAYRDLNSLGEKHRKKNPDFFRKNLAAIQPRDMCSIVYTSGTSGEPKGVMLHHLGFLTDIINSEAILKLETERTFLSVLPLSHLYERLAGHWVPFYRGATVAYAESLQTLLKNMQEVQPNFILGVPRLFEKIMGHIQRQARNQNPLIRKLFFTALEDRLQWLESGKPPYKYSFKSKLLDTLVFRPIRQRFGGNIELLISGGAPLSAHVLRFYQAIGLELLEGYGMTETHLVIALTPRFGARAGSCGKPIPGIEVTTADDGEILVRGDTVMLGYYNKPDLTREVIDTEGWFHTGDVGTFDDAGYLYITDRKKNIIVTSGGKNIAPAPIENALKQSPYIEEVYITGHGKKYLAALIVPDYELLRVWLRENDITPPEDNRTLVTHPRVQELIQAEIKRLTREFASYEKIKKFALLERPFSVEQGELTPSLKIRRNVVEERYREIINGLYQDEENMPSGK